jgi:7-keto-8-aminopelargonate synthetase-like enzyme
MRQRKLFPIETRDKTTVTIGGRTYTSFVSNDYLNLSQNEALAAELLSSVQMHGMGAGGSRLLGGDTALAHQLEAQLAAGLGMEAALIWASGYQTNLGIMSVLADKDTLVFADRFIHASWIDGVRLAGTRIQRFRHNDMNHLESLLKRYRGSCHRAIILVESLYSMDGDFAPIPDLIRFKAQYDTLLIIDEAHAFGAMGPKGFGCWDVYSTSFNGIERAADLYMSPHALRPRKADGGSRGGSPHGQGDPDPRSAAGAGIERAKPFHIQQNTPVPAEAGTGVFIVGTFGKACGSYGAFVACDAHWRQEFIQSARSFIYSTGLPLPVLAWNLAVVLRLESYAHLREKLWANVSLFREKIKALSPLGSSMIVPVLIDDERADGVVNVLRESGLWVSAVRYPTVPRGQSRLRMSLCADHHENDLAALAESLCALLR